ncbi:hypothetical protein HDU77_009897 [Chytriomyces hyalinus]|nr:hypothetical protein HDU77_009897 [Chytriomyces hyalinus]
MAPRTPIKNVDRDRLYTDIMYRYQYVSDFVGFDETDIKALKDAAPLIAPLVPVIADAVYDRLFSFDITKKVFLERGAGFHGHIAKNLAEMTTEDEQIKHRKNFLSKYLVKLVTAEYDAKFVKYLDYVGKIHTNTPDKKSTINVEYVHVNALFGWLHGFLAETLNGLPELQANPAARGKALAALSKLLWIQNDFFAMYYVNDGSELMGKKTKTSILSGVSNSSLAVVGCAMVSVFAVGIAAGMRYAMK